MPQLTALTPVSVANGDDFDVVFNPVRLVGPLAVYNDKLLNPGNMAAMPVLSISSVLPSKTSKLQKVRVKLVVPEPMRDALGVAIPNTKDFEQTFDATWIVPERASTEVREKFMTIAEKVIGLGLFVQLVGEAETVY